MITVVLVVFGAVDEPSRDEASDCGSPNRRRFCSNVSTSPVFCGVEGVDALEDSGRCPSMEFVREDPRPCRRVLNLRLVAFILKLGLLAAGSQSRVACLAHATTTTALGREIRQQIYQDCFQHRAVLHWKGGDSQPSLVGGVTDKVNN